MYCIYFWKNLIHIIHVKLYVIYYICLYHCLWSLEQHWQAVEDPDQGVTATGCPRSTWDIFKRMKGVSLHSIWHLRVHSFVYFTFSDDYPYTCKCETWHRFMLSCWAFLCFPATWKTVELNHDLREIVDANQIIICNLWAFVSIILRYQSERAISLAIASDLTPYFSKRYTNAGSLDSEVWFFKASLWALVESKFF